LVFQSTAAHEPESGRTAAAHARTDAGTRKASARKSRQQVGDHGGADLVALFPDTISSPPLWPLGSLPRARGRKSPAISILGIDRDQTHGRFRGNQIAKRLIFLMESASLQRRVHKNEFRFVAKGGQASIAATLASCSSSQTSASRVYFAENSSRRCSRRRRSWAGPIISNGLAPIFSFVRHPMAPCVTAPAT
jgi:hypothetical protein